MNDSERKMFVASDGGQSSVDLDGQAVILALHSGTYYRLDEVGSDIWKLLQRPRTLDEILGYVLDSYEVDEEEARHDLVDLIDSLVKANLVDVTGVSGRIPRNRAGQG